ncbi:eukaryotic translation initiation factor 4 gamma 3-like isoform X2 [Plodia interpunctella]|uniref:eukaryotic translation initiation factor 4 gamma 3-like isoform X2 n=1 Tax=Plodia interpunctella TaxID=58824 RepID=UPI002368B16E|nr:eukaryotic translation initiation factor 4 gamma 3-like isoform X2 [Plodia interpunctella]
MPLIVSPLFWEWFNIWLVQFLKDLYHEIKMVALRGTNSSINSLSHSCINHGNQSQPTAIDVAQSLQTSVNIPQSAVAQHMNAGQINLPINNVSVQFVPQHTNPTSLKHEQSARYSNSNCMMPSHHYRLLTQTRPVDCYHPAGATAAPYLQSGAGGAQSSGQAALRVQQNPQPSAPPAPQQDLSKTTMAHNFVAQPNQTPQSRPQYNFQYRTAQHGTRQTTHPRQQQPFIPGATAAATGPVMYSACVPPLVFQSHMGMQTYQQPRSGNPGFYPYSMGPYMSYSNPPSHTAPYFYTSNSQPLQTPNLQPNAPGGRSNPSTPLVGPQGTTPTPNAPNSTLPHPQAPAHIHQAMSGIRPLMQKRSHRLPIINPVTQQDIFSEINSNENQYPSGDSSGRQTPQSEHPTHSAAEEFSRRVNEVINQPSPAEIAAKAAKTAELPNATHSTSLPPTNAICISKPENILISESKNLGPDVAAESIETPVVSAISDSPVIVPKMPNNKQLQKNSDQPVVIESNTSKNQPIKQQKQNKIKPVVPDDVEREVTENISPETSQGVPAAASIAPPVPAPATVNPSSAPIPTHVAAHVQLAPSFNTLHAPAPQPQRIREHRSRLKSEEKEKIKETQKETHPEIETSVPVKANGPTSAVVISSVDSLQEVINPPTSQNNQTIGSLTKKQPVTKISSPALEIDASSVEAIAEPVNKVVVVTSEPPPLTATELLSASIEKLAKELPASPEIIETRETSSVIQAQAKLTQSIASCIRTNQADSKMKDINLNNKSTDPDTANGNTTELTKTDTKEDINKNEKVVKNSKNNNKKSNKMATNDVAITESESYENGKDETDKLSNVDQENLIEKEEAEDKSTAVETEVQTTPVFVPKYKYSDDQWSPLNKSGKKCYDIGLLKQIKDDPMSKNKPNVPLLEACNIMRAVPIQDPLPFSTISRPMNDSLFPTFAKPSGMGSRSNTQRDAKKDGRNMAMGGKGSVKLNSSQGGNSGQRSIHFVTLSREEVKLNEVDSAWKPSRFRKENLPEEDCKTQELYKKFRGILNKLTPQKFDTLLDKVKTLDINNQKRLEGVIDLVFEKAIDEPNFSEAYAAMCNKLSTLKVPAHNASSPEQCVNFRGLIISKCQAQFIAEKVDEQILKLEKEISECTDPAKKKELQLMLVEEYRRVRMRSVGNVRFIGELYKLKMLTAKIMVYCMNHLIEKLEEEKLECLCKLLTTIGEQVESEVKDQLDNVFKKMQDIISDRKNNKISSRVRFMIQDVIELRRRKWVIKSVVDSQPKMMDQIQKEAEQQQRHIEMMNAVPMGGGGGGFRRDEGGRGKRGERRQNSNSFQTDTNMWKSNSRYTVDTSKLMKAAPQKNLNSIKLAPPSWNHGAAAKSQTQATSSSMIGMKNMYSVLENVQTDPTSLRDSKDLPLSYHSKGASIERSTFNSRGDFNSGSGSRSGSIGVPRSNSGSRSVSAAPPTPPPVPEVPTAQPAPVPQEPLPEPKKKSVHSMIELSLINPDEDELVAEIKHLFEPQYHAAVVTEIFNVVLEKPAKDVATIAKSLLYAMSAKAISPDNFIAGATEIFEFAPDLYIDIPMLYEYFGKFIAPLIEKKHITFLQVFKISKTIINEKHGHLLLKAIIKNLKDSMGPTFVKSKWQESGLKLKQWMSEEEVTTWLQDNKFEFLEGSVVPNEETKVILSPTEAQKKLLQLMNSEETCDCIKGWVQDNLGKASNEDWFMRGLIQAICEHALFGAEGREVTHFNQERMNKYIGLINEFGESKQAREASCLFGIQQLIHRLEHPQGLTLQIFAYLHEQYIISVEGFIEWEESDKEPEGKGVMLKALTSFFTNLKEADNEDSCSEE